jgi:Asp-tRNA(Asn)/Glu-tRNA(Gln) amidotransferase A subunit family amidase
MDYGLAYMTATELAAAIRTRRVSPVEVVTALLERIERVNPSINAFCTVVAEAALREARKAEAAVMAGSQTIGPLHGVPISFKDLTSTAGIRTTFGSRIFEHYVPDEDAVVVERARRAGAIVVGKTNTPEFGCKSVTDNAIFGDTRNPWSLDRIPGGSSGGAAAALAAGLGPLAEGSDFAGSIRIPASCCGVVGLKPSLGRVPVYPNLNGASRSFNGWSSWFTVGPMARTVRDTALLLSVMAGPDDRDPQSIPSTGEDFADAAAGSLRGLRVAWSPDLGYARVDPEVRRITEAAAMAFVDLGCSVNVEHPGFPDAEALFLDISAPIRAAGLVEYLPKWLDQMDPVLVKRVSRVEGITAVQYELAVHGRSALWHTVRRFFERYDLLLTPTLSVASFPIGTTHPAEIDGGPASVFTWFPFTFPFNLTGQPAMSVPAGWTPEGLPVGLQIVGRRFGDATVLRAGAAFEMARPWTHRRPAL